MGLEAISKNSETMVDVDQKSQAETPHLQGHHLRIQLPTSTVKKSSSYLHEVVDAKNTGGGDFPPQTPPN